MRKVPSKKIFLIVSISLGHRTSIERTQDQMQSPRGFLKKRCSEDMQLIYRKTPMPKCDFSNFFEITLRHGCFPVNLLHIFRTPLLKNTTASAWRSSWTSYVLYTFNLCPVSWGLGKILLHLYQWVILLITNLVHV